MRTTWKKCGEWMETMWCNLMEKGHGKFSGWSYDPTRDMWVCGSCRKPSKATYLAMSDPSAKV